MGCGQRARRRLSIGGYILAKPEDFNTALELWNARQKEKVDETAVKVLNQLGAEEPHENYDDRGRVIGWTPEPISARAKRKRNRRKKEWKRNMFSSKSITKEPKVSTTTKSVLSSAR